MSSVTPMLAYEDPTAALEWLARAFGFCETVRLVNDQGRIDHAEMEIEGGGKIMLAFVSSDYQSPKRHRESCAAAAKWLSVPWVVNGVHVYVADVDAHHARAVAAGARVLGAIERGYPGDRYRVEDLEGQRWMFMARVV